eukprot:CAMPEP_0117424210 /NCGR_PEP_ID=MMETSP0758-20121206/4675_1 /TAXON_ID=63605 /ORGANISM="Percolomonas cosmopolitus, Strain AE-1 (ATCC 50343)" /LENGTH=613 /DNA_ID=CAMNT_0005207853 /DNA_START=308 /DNA_END=2146 /DNA_ORIENTATION=+
MNIVKSSSNALTPRGLAHRFSIHDIQEEFFDPYFDTDENAISYDLYLLHGKKTIPSVRAAAITKGYELERLLLDQTFIQTLFQSGKPTLSPFENVSNINHEFMKNSHLLRKLKSQNCPTPRSDLLSKEAITTSLQLQLKNISSGSQLDETDSYQDDDDDLSYESDGEDYDDEFEQPPKKTTPNVGMSLNLKNITQPTNQSFQRSAVSSLMNIYNTMPNVEPLTARRDRELEESPDAQLAVARCLEICSHIREEIYIGSDVVARNKDLLKKNNITHVINCASLVCKNYHPDDFKYISFPLYDAGSEPIMGFFVTIVDYIEKIRSKEKNARFFFHCQAGVSRSGTMAMSYLMWRFKLSFEEVLTSSKKKRSCLSPNAGFIVQLMDWEKIIKNKITHLLFRFAPLNDRSLDFIAPKYADTFYFDERYTYLSIEFKPNSSSKTIQDEHIIMYEGEKSSKESLKAANEFASAARTTFNLGENAGVESFVTASQLKSYHSSYPPCDSYEDTTLFDKDPVKITNEDDNSSVEEDKEENTLPEEEPVMYQYVKGNIQMIDNFDSEDLDDNDVFLIDPKYGSHSYIWVGEHVSEEFINSAVESLKKRVSKPHIMVYSQEEDD